MVIWTTMEVRANINLDDVRKRLSQIAGDKSVQKKIDKQQQQIGSLEKDVAHLRELLNKAPHSEAKSLRKRRNVVIKKIDELANLKFEIVQKIRASADRVLKYVELGMTREETKNLAGNPRSGRPHPGGLLRSPGDRQALRR